MTQKYTYRGHGAPATSETLFPGPYDPSAAGRSTTALLFVLLALLPRAAAGQELAVFRHLTIADGLSQNTVTAIVQDRRGFMWLGTRDGLNRYDGYEFVVFHHDPADSSSSPATRSRRSTRTPAAGRVPEGC